MLQTSTTHPHLTETDISFFKTEGYLKIEQAIPFCLLSRLQQMFHRLMFEYAPFHELVRYTKNGTEYISNIEHVCNKDNLAALELLGYPIILQIAETICGPDFFPIQDFSVIKMKGDDSAVFWHQDMENQRSAPSFTMGIYLDDADEHEGALRVVPGSHRSGKNICTLIKEGNRVISAKAGDILIHDMLTAHSSGSLTNNAIRRVIYFEFLSPELVRAENIYPEDLIRRRTALVPAALKYYQQQHSAEPGFEWKNSLAAEYCYPGTVEHQLKQIYAAPVGARPSAYCFE